MPTQQQFIDFLREIEPSPSTTAVCSSAHNTLRANLAGHATYSLIHDNTFLSGSYARDTALRPRMTNGVLRRPDVDIIVVTKHKRTDTPSDVIKSLHRAVKSLGYASVESNRRSICVTLTSVEMDVVPIIPNPWQTGGWLIADKSTQEWIPTNPMGHTDWAIKINKKANGNFKPLVKLVKWWRRENLPNLRRPKGFILETIVAELMDYKETRYEELFVKLLERIVSEYAWNALLGTVPSLADPSVEGNNVFSRVQADEFKRFYDMAEKHAKLIRRAQKEPDADKALGMWQQVFGDRFRKSAPRSGSLLRDAAPASAATAAAGGLGIGFPARAVTPPNKPPGFA
ncbi:nucleotidyltransferase [Pelomonas sp. Root1444]|uniref:SMODS domain-containing nucleotidyltransferase n=1 Tax=Pelomonas sp. Root1444 TaxID=1736464 RepID=UPI00070329BA|nr:nucleotidyltransferase [Pelomonas sp. Root1444]KQY80901.1 hypothetical protein ASD35_03380 [Pelomonas sp. Root1444]